MKVELNLLSSRTEIQPFITVLNNCFGKTGLGISTHNTQYAEHHSFCAKTTHTSKNPTMLPYETSTFHEAQLCLKQLNTAVFNWSHFEQFCLSVDEITWIKNTERLQKLHHNKSNHKTKSMLQGMENKMYLPYKSSQSRILDMINQCCMRFGPLLLRGRSPLASGLPLLPSTYN